MGRNAGDRNGTLAPAASLVLLRGRGSLGRRWVLPPLVICAVGAHKEILVKTESKSIRWLRCVKKSIETTGIRASGITRKTQVRGAMKRMKILATLLATIACALPAAAQYDETAKSFHLLPHLADGGGWQSVLLVTNTSQSASSCTFNVYGVPLNRFSELGSFGTAAGSTATFQLASRGGYLTWPTKNELAAVASGYATLDCSSPVVAQVVFASFDGLGVTAAATVFSAQAATVFQFLVLQPAATLGFAIANDTNAEASCRIVLEDYQRTNLGEATLSVPAKSNRAQLLTDIIAIPGTFLGGTATVSCNQPVAIIGLHFELRDGTIITFSTLPPAILSTIPADTGDHPGSRPNGPSSSEYEVVSFAVRQVPGSSLAVGLGAPVFAYRLTLRNPTNEAYLYKATIIFRDRDGLRWTLP